MFRPTIPKGWKPRLNAYLIERYGVDCDRLGAQHFRQVVNIRFPDGSNVRFKHAFALLDESRSEVAVFTEHCGYHAYPAVDAEIEIVDPLDSTSGEGS